MEGAFSSSSASDDRLLKELETAVRSKERMGLLTRELGPWQSSMLYVGPVGTLAPCHWDALDNCFTQLAGTKQVLLFAPDQSGLRQFPTKHPFDSRSQVDLEAPTQTELIELRGKGALATLNAGDTLFIPHNWWHHIHASQGSETERLSISLNMWFNPFSGVHRHDHQAVATYLGARARAYCTGGRGARHESKWKGGGRLCRDDRAARRHACGWRGQRKGGEASYDAQLRDASPRWYVRPQWRRGRSAEPFCIRRGGRRCGVFVFSGEFVRISKKSERYESEEGEKSHFTGAQLAPKQAKAPANHIDTVIFLPFNAQTAPRPPPGRRRRRQATRLALRRLAVPLVGRRRHNNLRRCQHHPQQPWRPRPRLRRAAHPQAHQCRPPRGPAHRPRDNESHRLRAVHGAVRLQHLSRAQRRRRRVEWHVWQIGNRRPSSWQYLAGLIRRAALPVHLERDARPAGQNPLQLLRLRLCTEWHAPRVHSGQERIRGDHTRAGVNQPAASTEQRDPRILRNRIRHGRLLRDGGRRRRR